MKQQQLKKRNDPCNQSLKIADQQTNDCTKKYKKYLKRAFAFFGGFLLGYFFGRLFVFLLDLFFFVR